MLGRLGWTRHRGRDRHWGVDPKVSHAEKTLSKKFGTAPDNWT
jgi:hypothetical protein